MIIVIINNNNNNDNNNNNNDFDIRTGMRVLQKSALLGTAHIIRKVLSV